MVSQQPVQSLSDHHVVIGEQRAGSGYSHQVNTRKLIGH
jgi:hypothetical protein